MVDRTRDESGRYSSDIGPQDVFEIMSPQEPYMTSEIASDLNIPRRSAYKYLSSLHNEGKVRKKKPEERRVIWIKSDEG